MQGACFLACSKRSRTREAPTPTNISTKSDPETLKKGTFASPAMARASRVLPVPGGPTISTPRGILPPKLLNFWGLRRNSTSSDDLLFRLFDAGDVGQGHLHLALGVLARPTLAEIEQAAAP